MKKYDVIVVGGGLTGVAAAIAAARQGVSVLIIEKSNCFGGAAVNSLVMPFMRFHTKIDGKDFKLSRGIFAEVCKELDAFNSFKFGRDSHFKEEELKLILNRMVKNSGADILFRARLYDVVKEGDKIKSIKLACIGGSIEASADYYIDASGDAELAYLSGCPYRVGREEDGLCQPMTLCFRVANVNIAEYYSDASRVNKLYKEYQRVGKIKNPRENILVFKTLIDGVLHFNTTRIVKKNPASPFDITDAEIEAREQVFEIFNFLKENAKGFENASIISTALETGTRESRMIDGEYTLTKNDILDCKKFEDSIAACCYDIDIHNPEGKGTSYYIFPDGKYYTIPYRSLLPKKTDNLIVAGRCISSDHDAQASYRIMPTVCCLGEAAGVASSIAVKDNKVFKNVDIKKLQNVLLENGAFLG